MPRTSAPRLQLEPTSSRTTVLDGGWWPRTTDPAIELPAVIDALGHRRGTVTHILLNPGDWDSPHPRRLPLATPSPQRPPRYPSPPPRPASDQPAGGGPPQRAPRAARRDP